MGFKLWHEAFIFVLVFSVLIVVPCYLIAFFGTKMINEIGNFPTRAEEIQSRSLWKVMVVFVAGTAALAVFFHIFY